MFLRIGEEHQRAAEQDAVARFEQAFLDRLVVDNGAVGAAEVGEREARFFLADAGVLAGDFAVVELNQIAAVAAECELCRQFEPLAAVATLHDEQGSHGEILMSKP
jgi:hypothetical protein